MTRILHFADLHLDRSFAGLRMAPSEAAKRREELRAALRRIVELALELDVDALTVGGDLYEHECVTRDTANFIAGEFAKLAPKPVLIAPGNHDPYVPDGLYWQLDWPRNVHIFRTMTWVPVLLGENLTIWGAGHTGPAIRDNLLRELRVEGPGTNVALFHGSDVSVAWGEKPAHAPFERDDVANSRVDFALLGHYHGMRLCPESAPRYGYPGSPEPLDFSEEGSHYVLSLVAEQGALSVEPLPINEVDYEAMTVDVTGMTTSDHIRQAIRGLAGDQIPSRAITRVTLTGQAEPELDLDRSALLGACAEYFRYLDLVDKTEPPFDLDQIRDESTTRGAFVKMIEQRLAQAPELERETLEHALQYGLQAFAGQEIRRR
jgi:DNA repair exonuclease SbcCD nuclease subunit